MVHIGGRHPLLWLVMRYYAHFGHKEFILCLGYKGEVIKNFFLNYNEYLSNDFVLANGGSYLNLLRADIQDWRITFVDTGLYANVGQRLKAVQPYLQDEEMFLANYSDGLSDLHLPTYVDAFSQTDKVAGFVCVKPPHTSHVVDVSEDGTVKKILHVREAGIIMNGGYFVFRKEIFDYVHPGDELVQEPFHRLIAADKLFGYRYPGFWTCIDTFKEKQELDEMYARGMTPWEVWRTTEAVPAHTPAH
jgi:glucose-1-phosphate cytidylyltransferase